MASSDSEEDAFESADEDFEESKNIDEDFDKQVCVDKSAATSEPSESDKVEECVEKLVFTKQFTNDLKEAESTVVKTTEDLERTADEVGKLSLLENVDKEESAPIEVGVKSRRINRNRQIKRSSNEQSEGEAEIIEKETDKVIEFQSSDNKLVDKSDSEKDDLKSRKAVKSLQDIEKKEDKIEAVSPKNQDDEEKVLSTGITEKSDVFNEYESSDIKVDDKIKDSELKSRKVVRSSQRQKVTSTNEIESEDEQKRETVLNRLAEIEPKENTPWNSWLKDIKSAAAAATSTTVNRASGWTLNPKNILSTAVNITSQVAENVTSAVESAIGAPSPEELATIEKKKLSKE